MAEAVEDRGPLWWTRETACLIIGMPATTFDKSIRPLLPADAVVRGRAKRLWYYGPAIFKASHGRVSQQKQAADPDSDLWSEFDSPNLERLRAAKADQAEMDVAERTGRIIFIDQLRERLSGFIGQLKGYGERLQHAFGREAALMHNEFMEEVKAFDVESIGVVQDA